MDKLATFVTSILLQQTHSECYCKILSKSPGIYAICLEPAYYQLSRHFMHGRRSVVPSFHRGYLLSTTLWAVIWVTDISNTSCCVKITQQTLNHAIWLRRNCHPRVDDCTAVLSEAWAKLRDWASVAGRGRLLLSRSVAHVSLKTAVIYIWCRQYYFRSTYCRFRD